MAKQLNSSTGKGWFVAQGQSSVEALLSGGTSQKELAKLAGLFTGDPPKPNAGAVSNILKSLGWGPFNGQSPATAKKSAAPATAKTVARAAKVEVDGLPLPGRVEAFFEYKLGWNMSLTIQPHHIELLIRADDVGWNQLAMKFGPDEVSMLGDFLVSGGFCPISRISMRGPWIAGQEKIAAAKRIADAIAAIDAVDARLANQRERFEASRYDADISSFYLA